MKKMDELNTKLAIIGGGNIGCAMVKGLIQSGKIPDSNIYLTRRNINKLENLTGSNINKGNDNLYAVRSADMIILSVLPSQLMEVIDEIIPALEPERHIVVSVVTAYNIREIKQRIGKNIPVIRAMPNIAASVKKSMSCIAGEKNEAEHIQKVVSIFKLFGSTLVIDENLMASATILGACGIAFFMRYIRAASQGGIQVGFHPADAQFIAAQTALGATTMLLESGNHPEREIDKVTTPMGCTIAGLNEMEHNGLSSALIKGIVTSYNEINRLK